VFLEDGRLNKGSRLYKLLFVVRDDDDSVGIDDEDDDD
jgi:hypothetical protein